MDTVKHYFLLEVVRNNFKLIAKMLPENYKLKPECLCCDSFNTSIQDNRFGYRCHGGNCIAIHHPKAFKILEAEFDFLKRRQGARENS